MEIQDEQIHKCISKLEVSWPEVESKDVVYKARHVVWKARENGGWVMNTEYNEPSFAILSLATVTPHLCTAHELL